MTGERELQRTPWAGEEKVATETETDHPRQATTETWTSRPVESRGASGTSLGFTCIFLVQQDSRPPAESKLRKERWGRNKVGRKERRGRGHSEEWEREWTRNPMAAETASVFGVRS